MTKILSRLTAEQWTAARRLWERDSRPGFAWLAAELAAAHGVQTSRQAVASRARREAWAKRAKLKAPAPVPAQSPALHQRRRYEPDPSAGEPSGEVVELGIDDAVFPPLTAAEERFAGLVAQGRTKTAAYRAAFPISARWQSRTVHSKAWALAQRAEVAERVTALMRGAALANETAIADVLRQYLQRLYADPRELTEVRVGACRYCWGKGHRWQFTDGELDVKRAEHAERCERAAEDGKPAPRPFDEGGGGGFNVTAEPHPQCPSCGGCGQASVVLHDSRTYSESALALFDGVKETKEGIEVKLASRTDALEKIARFVGFFEADNAQKGAGDQRPDVATLDAMYDKAMAQWQAQREAVQGRMDRLKAKGLIGDGDRPAEG